MPVFLNYTLDQLEDETPHPVTVGELPISAGDFRWIEQRAALEGWTLEQAFADAIRQARLDGIYPAAVARDHAIIDAMDDEAR